MKYVNESYAFVLVWIAVCMQGQAIIAILSEILEKTDGFSEF